MNMQQISAKKAQLEERVTTPGYVATPRDAAEAAELVNQYLDELERLETTATVQTRTIEIRKVKGRYQAVEL